MSYDKTNHALISRISPKINPTLKLGYSSVCSVSKTITFPISMAGVKVDEANSVFTGCTPFMYITVPGVSYSIQLSAGEINKLVLDDGTILIPTPNGYKDISGNENHSTSTTMTMTHLSDSSVFYLEEYGFATDAVNNCYPILLDKSGYAGLDSGDIVKAFPKGLISRKGSIDIEAWNYLDTLIDFGNSTAVKATGLRLAEFDGTDCNDELIYVAEPKLDIAEIAILVPSTDDNVELDKNFTVSGTSNCANVKIEASADGTTWVTLSASTAVSSGAFSKADCQLPSASFDVNDAITIRVSDVDSVSLPDTVSINTIATITMNAIGQQTGGVPFNVTVEANCSVVKFLVDGVSQGTENVVDGTATKSITIASTGSKVIRVEDNSNSDAYDSETIEVVSGIETIAISVGSNHSLAIINNKVYAWGLNTNGQLGDGTTTNRTTPTLVNAINGESSLYGRTPVQVSAGDAHSLVLCNDGTVHAFGYNATGQLGDNSTTQRTKPVIINGGAISGKSIVWISAGSYGSSACVDSDGKAYAWGNNTYNQVGDGTTTQRNVPTAVATDTTLSGKTVTQISMGYYGGHCLTSEDGRFHGWGNNASGQIGDNSTTTRTKPVRVNNTTSLSGKTGKRVETKYDHTVFVCTDGTVHSVGTQYSSGNLGDGATGTQLRPVAVATDGALNGKTIAGIACGQNNGGMCFDSNGKAYGWGSNGERTIGDGTNTNRTKPVETATNTSLSGKTVIGISTNNTCTLFLCSDGTIHGCGSNSSYQIGDGTNTVRSSPVATTMPA